MPFSAYGDLTTAVANFLNRANLATYIDTLIDLGNRRIRREQEWDQRIFSMEQSNGQPNGPLAITQQGQILPAGVRIIKTLWPTSGSHLEPLSQTSFDELRSRAASNADATGDPLMFAIVPAADPTLAGPRLFLWPAPSGAFSIDFLYVNDPGNISTTNITALYLYAPDVYLFAALSESAPFLKHDERVPMWEQKYQSALATLNGQPMKQASGATLQRAKLRPIG
jgi:hypothetical protein